MAAYDPSRREWIPAAIVIAVIVAVAIALVVLIVIVASGSSDDPEVVAVTGTTTEAVTSSTLERCVVVNDIGDALAAFVGTEATVACEQFAIQARPDPGKDPWRVMKDAAAPPPADGRRVICELFAANAATVAIQDSGSAVLGRAECRRMRADGWKPIG